MDITNGINKPLKIENRLHKKYIKTKSLYYNGKYKLYRNKLNHLIKISKKEYHKYFESNNKNIKSILKGIKQIINIKPINSGLPSKIVLQNGEELTDSKQIATALSTLPILVIT